ncbi:MAG: DinB family protein [Saprospiraceae bacterium]
MNKQTILEQLDIHHAEFRHLIRSLSETEYLAAPVGKWNAGQQLDHICRSVGPVNLAFGLPGFLLRLLFGKANRPSRTYEGLVEKYKIKLAAGGRANGRFIPPLADCVKREKLLRKLERLVSTLRKKVEETGDNQMDTLILPHPLLGKLTLREMLYFTIYHVQHHQNLVLSNLERCSGR